MTTKQIIAISAACLTIVFALFLQNWFMAFWAIIVVIIIFWTFKTSSLISSKPVFQINKDEKFFSGEDIANTFPDAFFLINGSGNIIFINNAGRYLFPDLKTGTKFLSRFRDPAIVDLIQYARHSHEAKTAFYIEKGMQVRFFSVFVMAHDNMNNGKQDSLSDSLIVCIFRDISESRKLDRMRSDFIANASHELRTPLASLRGFIETLNGAAKNDAVAREGFLKIMQDQSERMSRLIDDLLSLSRLEMKTTLANAESIELEPLIHHVSKALSPLTNDFGMTIRFDIAPLEPIIGDRDELIQLFQNLIENACKYGNSGKFVDIIGTQDDKDVTITIQDHGAGIAPEHIPRLTERFYRVNTKMSHNHKGTGLGLAIVKHILAHHNGRLVIQSQMGEGSSFRVILPLEKSS